MACTALATYGLPPAVTWTAGRQLSRYLPVRQPLTAQLLGQGHDLGAYLGIGLAAAALAGERLLAVARGLELGQRAPTATAAAASAASFRRYSLRRCSEGRTGRALRDRMRITWRGTCKSADRSRALVQEPA
jgi:hypothetical protein